MRIDPDQSEGLLKERGASEFEMGGRGPMKGWPRVGVDADTVRDDNALSSWVTRGVERARTLPPKGKR